MTATRRSAAVTLLAAALLAAGCVVGPDYHRPPADVGDSFVRAAPGGSGVDPVDAEWWRALGDPVLDELLRRARQANHDLRIAEANLRAARALLGIERRDRYRTATARASAEREEASRATVPPGRPGGYSTYQVRYNRLLVVFNSLMTWPFLPAQASARTELRGQAQHAGCAVPERHRTAVAGGH